MNIGIIGSGKMGMSVGKLWADKGHSIFFSDVTLEAAKAAADMVNMSGIVTSLRSSQIGDKPMAKYGSVPEAVSFGEVLLLSVPYSSVRDVVNSISSLEGIRNKVVIDCINALSPDSKSLVTGYNTSAAEEVARLFPGGMNVRVVKALNTIASPVFESGDTSFGKDKATMFYCGDDGEAKGIVSKLIEELGFEPVDAGPLVNARFLEPLAALIIQLAVSQDMGTNIGLKLLRR